MYNKFTRQYTIRACRGLWNDEEVFEMIRFNNDYNRGALESILDGLTETNAASYAGYGEDQWCGRAEAVIKKLIAREDAMIKFVPGATQANIVAIAAALSPVQSVIAADTRAPQYRRQAHLAADRRLRGGVLRGRRPGVPYGAQAGIYFFPHRAGHPVFQEGASRHQRGLQKIRHVPVRGRGQDGVRPGGRG